MEARYVTCLVARVNDHATRGTKSILRYGWSLKDLANDTAGTFVENSKKVGRTAIRLGGMVESLRLMTFEITDRLPGKPPCFCFFDVRIAAACSNGHRL